jgi:prevent-host-death family protein
MATRLYQRYDIDMRTVSALDVRRRFGEIVDRAAAGERIVIERAGHPVAAMVPLADLELVDPERRRAARLAALDDIRKLALRAPERRVNAAKVIRDQRRARHGRVGRQRSR